MPALELFRVKGRTLRVVSCSFEPGLHAVVGGDEAETAELVRIAAGVVAPKSGSVRVLGESPFSSPRARRAIGALLRDEEPTVRDGTAGDAARLALALHGSPTPTLDAFDRLGLRALIRRRAASLSKTELRAVALGVALSVPSPALLVLHEPFTVSARRDALERDLRGRAADGVVVLVVLASRTEAAELGANLVSLAAPGGGGASVVVAP